MYYKINITKHDYYHLYLGLALYLLAKFASFYTVRQRINFQLNLIFRHAMVLENHCSKCSQVNKILVKATGLGLDIPSCPSYCSKDRGHNILYCSNSSHTPISNIHNPFHTSQGTGSLMDICSPRIYCSIHYHNCTDGRQKESKTSRSFGTK